MSNTIRITSGELKGRKISTPGGKTHPMGERERLALFNMVSGHVPGAVVLDAFAGSGALGFEALSRGAREVLFVDSSPEAEHCIIENMMSLGYFELLGHSEMDPYHSALAQKPKCKGTADVIRAKISHFKTDKLFDLVLADPPYDRLKPDEIEHLVRFIKQGGILALSHPGDAPTMPGLTLKKSRKYAGATISVYVKG